MILLLHTVCADEVVPHTNGYICTVCSHKTCKTRKCLCCLHHVPSTEASVYCNTDDDLSLYVVYTLLYNCMVSSCETNQNEHFICNVCKATLITATQESQHVPRFVKLPIARAGANFLDTLQDKPECICTVCHQLLFWKSVRVFDVANYNISNAIVNKCLSFRCITQVGCSTNEFICFHCKTCLQKKTPKMPNQAHANGLDLYVISPELCNLFSLERRVISLCIPFITMIIMQHHGGHYKMNGAPVYVPATLDHVLNVLLRMPNQLQLHPMKLK